MHFWNTGFCGWDAISAFEVDGIECFTIMRRKLGGGDVDNLKYIVRFPELTWAGLMNLKDVDNSTQLANCAQ